MEHFTRFTAKYCLKTSQEQQEDISTDNIWSLEYICGPEQALNLLNCVIKMHYRHDLTSTEVTVPLKSKLTVTYVSILKTWDSILEIFEDQVSRLEDRVSSFDDRGSSFKFRFKKALSLKVYTYLSFEKSRLLALGETRLLSPKRSSRFESENVPFWSPVNSPFETCFLEVKARYIYVIAFKE